MAECPACNHEVRTPAFFNLDGWSHLACSECNARLEMKPRPVAISLFPVVLAASWLGRLGHTYSIIAEVLLVLAMVGLALELIIRPQVRVRKRPLPKPEVRLNINGPSN